MTQEAKLYWPRHKVFFLATLVLFPDKFTVRPLDPWFFRPYFNFVYDNDFGGAKNSDSSLEWATVLVDDYQNDGYIKYKKVSGLYKITDIDTAKATKDLMHYLKQWQQDELRSLSASKPPDVSYQQELLLNAIVHVRANHQSEPRITFEDIYGKRGDYKYEPPFWELVLSYQLLDSKVEIKDLGYDQRIDGLYEDSAQPFVEYRISDEKLTGQIDRRIAKHAEPDSTTMAQTAQTTRQNIKANIIITDHIIYATLDDGSNYRISRQLRNDLSPHLFISHMLHHPRTFINRHDIKEATDNGDITELVRRCGFDKALKKIFFPDTTEQAVCFQPTPVLNKEQVKLLAEHEWDKPRKGGKT